MQVDSYEQHTNHVDAFGQGKRAEAALTAEGHTWHETAHSLKTKTTSATSPSTQEQQFAQRHHRGAHN